MAKTPKPSARVLRNMAVWHEQHAAVFADRNDPRFVAMCESHLLSAHELRVQADEVENAAKKAAENRVAWCVFCKKRHAGGATCMGHHP